MGEGETVESGLRGRFWAESKGGFSAGPPLAYSVAAAQSPQPSFPWGMLTGFYGTGLRYELL